MTRVTLDDTPETVMVKMMDGNPGAMTVLMQLFRRPNGIFKILKLDTLEIYGPAIWVIYKDLMGEDITLLDEHLENDTLMEEIEIKCKTDPYFRREWENYGPRKQRNERPLFRR